jgi:hypothetical protein
MAIVFNYGMEPGHYFPARRILETEDIAADFLENGFIGRHDWMNNWPAYRARHPDLRERIAAWLRDAGYDADPAEIEAKIDQLILTRPGRYR